MKSGLVFLMVVGVALAQTLGLGGPAGPGPALGGPGPVLGGLGPTPGGLGGPAFPNTATGNPYGPRAYGMGLNNPWAFPPNPFLMRRALAIVKNVPGALVRVDADGEITFTNQFGAEVDILDGFGNDLGDLID